MLSVALNRDEHIGAVLSPPPPEQASIKGVPEVRVVEKVDWKLSNC